MERPFEGSPADVAIVVSRPGISRRIRCALALCATFILGSLLTASSAVAAASIGGFIGGPVGTTGGAFSAPRDIAVNASGAGAADPGDIYVVDTNVNRIQVLDANGDFKFMFGRDVIVAGAPGDLGDTFEKCTVATDCKVGSNGTTADGPGGEFNSPQGIAIDQSTGAVFVREVGGSTSNTNRRIQQFDAAGNFVRAFGWNVIAEGTANDTATDQFEVCTVAVDCQQAAVSGSNAGQFASSSTTGGGISVSSTNGHVFAGDPGNRRVLEFDPSAPLPVDVFVRAWGWGVDSGPAGGAGTNTTFEACTTASGCAAGFATAGTENGKLATNSPVHLAGDSQNVVYVADAATGTVANRVVRFDADLAPASGDATAALLQPVNPSTAAAFPPAPNPLLVSGTTVTSGLKIDDDIDAGGADEEMLLVARDPATGNTVVQQLDIPTDAVAGELPTDNVTQVAVHTIAAQPINGLGYNPNTNIFYVTVAVNAPTGPGQGVIVLADTPGPLSGVTMEPADQIGSRSATLRGQLNPSTGTASYLFETNITGADNTWVPVGTRRYRTGSNVSSVSASVTGLAPSTLYRARFTASKQTGFNTASTITTPEQLFVTDAEPPTVTTLAATPRRLTSAGLQGRVNPNGSATTYWFEYGRTTSYGRKIPVPAASAGAGTADKVVAQNVGGLEHDTTYHYRIIAENAYGTAIGADSVFTTRAPVSSPGRAYELVSPPDKVSGAGVGVFGVGDRAAESPGFTSLDGERYVSASSLGRPLLDCPFEFANSNALADRVPQALRWINSCAINRRNYGDGLLRYAIINGVSDDLSLISWASNFSHVGVFPEVEEFPQAWTVPTLSDWGEKWEVIGPTTLAQGQGTGGVSGMDGAAPAVELSSDGSHAVVSSGLRGLSGPADPSLDMPAQTTQHPWITYIDDVSAGLSDSFPGAGIRTPVGVCDAGTVLPARVDGGGGVFKQGTRPCPSPVEYAPGQFRDGALVDSRGSSITGSDFANTKNVISEDGSRVFFMSPDPYATEAGYTPPSACSGTGATTSCPPQLYVRQRNSDGTVMTRWISRTEVTEANGASADQDAALMARVRFEGATPDGDKVFFRSIAPLTADDPNGTGGSAPAGGVVSGTPNTNSSDLFMYDFPDSPNEDPANGDLVRISRGPTGAADGNVSPGFTGSGAARFISDDGGRVYFVSAAPIPGVANPANGTTTSPSGTASTTATTNLYLYDAGGGTESWRFITSLPRSGSIAGCATSGEQVGDPLGISSADFVVSDLLNCFRGTSDGSFVTFWTNGALVSNDLGDNAADVYAYDAKADELIRLSAPQGGEGGAYMCVTGSGSALCNADGGRASDAKPRLGLATSSPARIAFFESKSRLVQQDDDDEYDVYKWENGDLSLISTDTTTGAYYTGNSSDGEDVFFMSRERLSWQDHDGEMDIYDARNDGGFAQPPDPPVICAVLADGCQGRTPDPVPAGVTATNVPGADDPTPGARTVLSIATPGAKARKRAATLGVLSLKVTSSASGRVTAVLRAKLGKRVVTLAQRSASVAAGKTAKLRLRLIPRARKQLRRGRSLRATVSLRMPGARSRSLTLQIPGVKR